MASMDWWRSWHGAPTDHKWAVIAARSGTKVGIVSAIAWALFDYASQHEERGTVDGFDTETYAVYSGFEEKEIIAVIKAMTDKGIIVDGRLANWEKRQPKREDNSAERVRKYRELKRYVTQGNAEPGAETIDKSREDKSSTTTPDGKTPPPPPPAWLPLSQAFTEATNIPEMHGGPGLFYPAIETMVAAGVIPEDIKQAVESMGKKGYTISTIASITNPAITAMSQRTKPLNGKQKRNSGKSNLLAGQY